MSEKNELISTGIKLIQNKMLWGSAGNISVREKETHIVITASGSYLGNLSENDCVKCDIKGSFEGKKPSKELPLHLVIYRQRPDIGAIIHATPFYATMAACSNIHIKKDLFIESMYYAEKITSIVFENPGSQQLAECVEKVAKTANIILMRNHGVLVYDTTIQEAYTTLEVLETVCRMNFEAIAAGINLQEVPAHLVQDFLCNSGYKLRRTFFEENR